MARLNLVLGRHDEALRWIEHGLAREPNSPTLAILLAETCRLRPEFIDDPPTVSTSPVIPGSSVAPGESVGPVETVETAETVETGDAPFDPVSIVTSVARRHPDWPDLQALKRSLEEASS